MLVSNNTAIIIGYFGTVFLSLRFLPQIYKSYKKRRHYVVHQTPSPPIDLYTNEILNAENNNGSSPEISLIFIILEILTCICFGFYGIYFKIWPMLISNSISFIGCSLVYILEYL